MKFSALFLFLFCAIAATEAKAFWWAHIQGPDNVCPNPANIYYYHYTDNLSGGWVYWTVYDGKIKDPYTGTWSNSLAYAESIYPTNYQHEIKFDGPDPYIQLIRTTSYTPNIRSSKQIIYGPPESQASILGDDKLMNCGSYSNSYTLSGVSDGWEFDDIWVLDWGLVEVSSSGNNIRIKPKNSYTSGSKNLKAQITWVDDQNYTCGTQYVTKNINVVPPTLTVTGPTQICPGGLYQYYAKFDGAVEPVPGASYTWTFPSGYFSLNGNHNYSLNLQTPQYNVGGGAVRATVTLSCGTFIDGVTIYPYCYGNYTYSASPNPAADAITVELKTIDNTKIKVFDSNEDAVRLALINKDGKVLESRQLKTAKETIDISKLQPDIYYLKIPRFNHQVQ